jgi:hypothetical protein
MQKVSKALPCPATSKSARTMLARRSEWHKTIRLQVRRLTSCCVRSRHIVVQLVAALIANLARSIPEWPTSLSNTNLQTGWTEPTMRTRQQKQLRSYEVWDLAAAVRLSENFITVLPHQ